VNFKRKHQYFGSFVNMVWAMENMIIPLDGVHQAVLGTRIGTHENVPGRIGW
jgi:hypothetical protein